VYALSPGSRVLLAELGAWPAIDARRVAPIRRMQVWGDDARSEIDFDALECGAPDLGVIVEAGELQWALWQAVIAEPRILRRVPATCAALDRTGNDTHLRLASGEELHAALAVGADGADSWVRRAAGIAAVTRDYGESGVVANFACARAHEGIARQWFRRDGVLAWLPLPGAQISMVWSAEQAVAKELLSLDREAFDRRVAEAGGNRLGALCSLGPRVAFPLQMLDPEHAVAPGVALVGDAAHVIHPLAGQGVNVGFRDVRVLAQVLRARGRHERPGEVGLLRRYERARREDWLASRWVTDGLHGLFAARQPVVRAARNLGLAATHRADWLKRRLMAHAMQ